MRTTLNLDDDVVRQLAERVRTEGRSLSRIANEAIRAGLSAPRLTAYDLPVSDTGRTLVDVTDIAGALELLERSY